MKSIVSLALVSLVGCAKPAPAPSTPTVGGEGTAIALAAPPAEAPGAKAPDADASAEPGSGTAMALEGQPPPPAHQPETLVQPLVQTTWNTPSGSALATLYTKDYKTEVVVTLSDKSRHVPLAVALPPAMGEVHLRVVAGKLVMHWLLDDNTDAGQSEDWLIEWNAKAHAPAKVRHWIGKRVDKSEPAWAGGPAVGPDTGEVAD